MSMSKKTDQNYRAQLKYFAFCLVLVYTNSTRYLKIDFLGAQSRELGSAGRKFMFNDVFTDYLKYMISLSTLRSR